MRRKTHRQKVASAEDRKVLRRRLLRVLELAGTVVIAGRLTMREEVVLRIAALVRELEDTQ